MQMQRPFSQLAVSPLVAVAGAALQTVALRPKGRTSSIRERIAVKPLVFNTPLSLLCLPFISSLFSPAMYRLTPR